MRMKSFFMIITVAVLFIFMATGCQQSVANEDTSGSQSSVTTTTVLFLKSYPANGEVNISTSISQLKWKISEDYLDSNLKFNIFLGLKNIDASLDCVGSVSFEKIKNDTSSDKITYKDEDSIITFNLPTSLYRGLGYTANEFKTDTIYYWKVECIEESGYNKFSSIWCFKTNSNEAIDYDKKISTDFALYSSFDGTTDLEKGLNKLNLSTSGKGLVDSYLGNGYPSLKLDMGNTFYLNNPINIFTQAQVKFDVRIGESDSYSFDDHLNSYRTSNITDNLDRFINYTSGNTSFAGTPVNAVIGGTENGDEQRVLMYSTDFTSIATLSTADKNFLYVTNSFAVDTTSTESQFSKYGNERQSYTFGIPKAIRKADLSNATVNGWTTEAQGIFNACYKDVTADTKTITYTVPVNGSATINTVDRWVLRSGLTDQQMTDLSDLLYAKNSGGYRSCSTSVPGELSLVNIGSFTSSPVIYDGAPTVVESVFSAAGQYTLYRVELIAGESYYCSLTSIPTGNDYDMSLWRGTTMPGTFDATNSTTQKDSIATSNNQGNSDDNFEFDCTSDGTYYLKVYVYDGTGNINDTYVLTFFRKRNGSFTYNQTSVNQNTANSAYFKGYNYTTYQLKSFDQSMATSPSAPYTTAFSAADRNKARSILERNYQAYFTKDSEVEFAFQNSGMDNSKLYDNRPFVIKFDVTMDSNDETVYVWGSYIDSDNTDMLSTVSGNFYKTKYVKYNTGKKRLDWIPVTVSFDLTKGSYTVNAGSAEFTVNYNSNGTKRLPSNVDGFYFINSIGDDLNNSSKNEYIWLDNLDFTINDTNWTRSIN